jgi:CheY-like chemotaxis protein
MNRKKILIVDDSDSVCDAIAALVSSQGHIALTAYDGEQGLNMVRRGHPDLILLDIMMPVMDGWEMMRQLKADPAICDIPVLALTALRLSAEQVAAAGFDGYLSKPVAPHRLLEEIGRATSRAG